jgi:hypothetical protein
MTKNNDTSLYDIGFSKPPEQTRFRTGVSGNPKGRPKGRKNLATVLERTLQEKVVINENGVRKTVTKLEAAIKQLMNKAASGDLKALYLLTGLVRSGEERADQAPVADSQLAEVDQKVLQGLLKRLENTEKGDE